MNKYLVAGQVSNIELKQSQQGKQYLKINIERCFIKQDGQPQIITEYVSAFNDYIMQQYAQGLIRVGNYVVVEGTISGESYQAKDGTTKVAMNVVANTLNNLSLREIFAQSQPTQQPQQPVVNNIQAQAMQAQQPMFSTTTAYVNQPQQPQQPMNGQFINPNTNKF